MNVSAIARNAVVIVVLVPWRPWLHHNHIMMSVFMLVLTFMVVMVMMMLVFMTVSVFWICHRFRTEHTQRQHNANHGNR
ncbi:hypothetical protein FPK24_16500 [Vibrio parahaemolyticus]|nr:hypothetical protein [Vibrio parahaemolyticus]QGG35479.1 hypothetical protein GH799_20575 [Vibrio parahaemolyticus 10329]EGQ8376342.1 hypothetical protein [Vibrio parahaemolyticus]EGQ8382049.1 hypothetical protein [Vibrio parahaemolyticus]EGQ8383161.1 hypothetical protein [Vibrio parahaemolyticus]